MIRNTWPLSFLRRGGTIGGGPGGGGSGSQRQVMTFGGGPMLEPAYVNASSSANRQYAAPGVFYNEQ